MFDFDYEPRTGIFHIRAEGLWTLATLASFSASVLAKGVATRIRYGEFAVLADLRRAQVLPPEVATGLTHVLQQSLKITTAPFAMVTPSMLLKIQLARVMQAPHTRLFLDWDEANRWLQDKWISKR